MYYNGAPLHFTQTFSVDISAVSEPNFLKPNLFPITNDNCASVHVINSQLNLSNYLIAKPPSNPLLNLPFNGS